MRDGDLTPATRDLCKELEKEESFQLASDALRNLKLSFRQSDLADAWLLFNLVQKLPHLQSHLTVVANCIRDLTMPNIDMKIVTVMAEPKIRAGEATHYIQCFLLPKLDSILKKDYNVPLGSTYIECFDILQAAIWWHVDGTGELLQCFVYALRAEGDIPSAIRARSVLNHFFYKYESDGVEAHLDLLSLHVTGINAFQHLPSYKGKISTPSSLIASSVGASFASTDVSSSPGDVPSSSGDDSSNVASSHLSQLHLAFYEATLKSREIFRRSTDHYALDQYYLHSLLLLGRHQDLVTEYNKLIELKPHHKLRYLPWLLNAKTRDSYESGLKLYPPAIEEGVLPAPTAMLETALLADYYEHQRKDYTKEQCLDHIFALAEHIVATSKKQPFNVSSTPAIRALESTFPLFECYYLSPKVESLNKDVHSKLVTSALARSFASQACSFKHQGLADKAIRLFRSLWPRLNSADWHYFGRAYEVTEDFEYALEAYSKSGSDQAGSVSRICLSTLLAKMGRYDDSMELYNKICSEKEFYDSEDWILFDCEWGLFFSGHKFSIGCNPKYAVPTQYVDLNKAAIHLQRAIETGNIPPRIRDNITKALEFYKTLNDDQYAQLLDCWSSRNLWSRSYEWEAYHEDLATSHLRSADHEL